MSSINQASLELSHVALFGGDWNGKAVDGWDSLGRENRDATIEQFKNSVEATLRDFPLVYFFNDGSDITVIADRAAIEELIDENNDDEPGIYAIQKPTDEQMLAEWSALLAYRAER